MKVCEKCKQELNDVEFHKRLGGLQPNCKECQNALNRAYYASNKKKHITNVLVNRNQRIQRMYDWKATLKCSLCAESFSKCLDFHHLESDEKEFQISGTVGMVSFARLRKEMLKCVVLCKNCHTKVHYGIIDPSTLIALTEQQIPEIL